MAGMISRDFDEASLYTITGIVRHDEATPQEQDVRRLFSCSGSLHRRQLFYIERSLSTDEKRFL